MVDQINQSAIDKMDLLLVVDNSISMADKQALLSQAVPGLIERLVNPDCVQTDDDGHILARAAAEEGDCPEDFQREFNPVDDMHIGVVTSSLGGHGGDICSANGAGAGSWNETKDDQAHLLPTVRPELNLPAADPAGFLAWDPAATTSEQLEADFAEHVLGAGEVGCGYEATLEAWYRFLIEPTPAQEVVVVDDVAIPAQGPDGILVDQALLDQRNAFLRPDSLVAIVVLTDENDCSVVDGGIGWLTSTATFDGANFTMPAVTTQCESNPNDKCCRSCGLVATVEGCPALEADPNCSAGRPSDADALNLRCWNQKQRFGFDLLYPVSRYVDALTQEQIYDTHRCDDEGTCPLVQNPLFDKRGAPNPRGSSLVFLAGIVGVPWQDIATDDSLSDPSELEFMPVAELEAKGRWDVILGHPEAENPADASAKPTDPLMREQSDPRTGTHPITQEAVAPETSTNPIENSINGHEYVNNDGGDLQYACIFPLAESRDCADVENLACDCTESDLPKNRPLCNPPEGGEAGLTQYYAKAYPSLRLLQALRDFGDNSIVASICPKVTDPEAVGGGAQDPAFGYNPAIAALVDRTKAVLGGRCLPRAFDVDSEGQIACKVVEVTRTPAVCDPTEGRAEVGERVGDGVRQEMAADGLCGGATGVACDEYSLCEIVQLEGELQDACLHELDYADGLPGFCYIDAAQGIGNESLLVGCPETQPRKLRFVGDNTPRAGALSYLVCLPDAASDE